MSGSAVPVASAGSKKAGVSDTCTPHVIVPSAASAGALHAIPARRSAAAAPQSRADITRVERAERALPAMCSPWWAPRGRSGRVGIDAVLFELLAQGVAVDAEELGGPHLVALGLAHDRAQERLLHQPDHEAVQVGGGVAAEPAHALD